MKTITLRNVPDELHARLAARAKANRRSLNQEVIAELVIAELSGKSAAESENEGKTRVEREIKRAAELRSRMRGGYLTASEIDAATEEGRA